MENQSWNYLQLQQRQVGVAVISLVFALLHDISLEYFSRLWIVSVESVENVVNVLRSLHGGIEYDTHDCVVKVEYCLVVGASQLFWLWWWSICVWSKFVVAQSLMWLDVVWLAVPPFTYVRVSGLQQL